MTDEELMLAYGRGDATSFERLYARHKGGLYRYLLRGSSKAMVDELFQDVWMKVIDSRKRYRATAQFNTWLYRIAHNRLVDYYRRQRPQAALDDVQLTSDKPDPQQVSESAQLQAEFDAGLQQLPEEQRQAFVLQNEAGCSVKELAEITGVDFETAKSRLRYARAKLKAVLADRLGATA